MNKNVNTLPTNEFSIAHMNLNVASSDRCVSLMIDSLPL